MFRRLSILLFAALTFLGLGRDLVASISTGEVQLLSLGQFWFRLDPSTLNGLQAIVQRYIASWAWDPAIVFVLQKPTWTLPLIMSVLLLVVRRHHK